MRNPAYNYLSTLSEEKMRLKINQISIGDDKGGVICVYAKIFIKEDSNFSLHCTQREEN